MPPRCKLWVLLPILLLLPWQIFAAEPARPGPRDRCPVCGMFVAPYPEWTATILFQDGTQLFFDGAKDLLRYYFSLPNQEDRRTREQIASIYVTDYYSTKLVPIEQVFFILGSDVYGPMGAELIPVMGEKPAKAFLRDHAGKQLLRFEQLRQEQLPVD